MKTTPALILLTAAAAATARADCTLPGLHHTTVAGGGGAPDCLVDASGEALITLRGDTRFTWTTLKVGPDHSMKSIDLRGGFGSVHYSTSAIDISGGVTADGPLSIVGPSLTIGFDGKVSAPSVLLSAHLPVRESDLDALFSRGAVGVAVAAPGEPDAGTVSSTGLIRATTGNITVLGRNIGNGGRIEAALGRAQLTAAEQASVTLRGATPTAARDPDGHLVLNTGTITGYTLELRALPPSCFFDPDNDFEAPNCVLRSYTPIINDGKLKALAPKAGIKLDTVQLEGTWPVDTRIELRDRSVLVLADIPSLSDPAQVTATLVRGGRVIPNDGDNPTVAAVSKTTATPATGRLSLLPPLNTAYNSLAAQPASAPAALAENSTSTTDRTRGGTAAESSPVPKKRGKPGNAKPAPPAKAGQLKPAAPVIVHGTFFGIPIRSEKN